MKSLWILPLVLAACGDNNKLSADAQIGRDAIDDTCLQNPDPACHPAHAVAAMPPANFGPPPGILSVLDVGTLTMHQDVSSEIVGGDPFVKMLDNSLYIINRTENNVTVLDTQFRFVGQLGTGAGSNPQDVAIVNNKLYIPALGSAGVIVGQLGSLTTTTIDLNAAVGSTDGKPDCVGVAASGNDLYVTCENLVGFVPATVGKLVVIDTTTDTVRTHIDLPVKNPQNLIVSMLDHSLVVSSYDKATGCTMKITPGPTPTATCLVQNSALATGGAEPTHIGTDGTKIWFAATTDYVDGGLRAYDTATSTLGALIAPASQNIRDVAPCPNGQIVVADTAGTSGGGLRVYQDGAERTTAALPIGLPPGFGNNLVCY
jgi:hypothetical protein